MNTLNHWNWLKDLETLQRNVDSLLSRSPTHKSERQHQLTASAEWSPGMHITELDKEYLIKAELPEVKEADLKISAEAGSVSISGLRKFGTEEKERKPGGIQPVCEGFSRTFSLPDEIRLENVRAEFKDGVLVVHLIKGEKATARQVEIEASRSA
jgi:HSP20 family protein